MANDLLSQGKSESPISDDNQIPTNSSSKKVTNEKLIGKLASPVQKESTSERFYFWIPNNTLVEKGQIIRVESNIENRQVKFYAIVDEVYRQSRKRNIGEEYDCFDGDINYTPEFNNEGVTFAQASILRTQPPLVTPPLEQSPVFLGNEDEARIAYSADEIDNSLPVGLIKNGGDRTAGVGIIDLDYLLGTNGGHMNINGVAGRGTKSSFLLFTVYTLLAEARRRQALRPSDPEPMLIVPIILNVKGFDLFYIDKLNKNFSEDHKNDWRALGVETPIPFADTKFYAVQMSGGSIAIQTGRSSGVVPYSWSLSDIIERGLLLYLFSDEDANDANFGALVLDIEAWLTEERLENDGKLRRALRSAEGKPRNFDELLKWVSDQSRNKEDKRELSGHHSATWGKFRRRLLKLLLEGSNVLRRQELKGNPLNVASRTTCGPIVVDLNGLTGVASLQRFVVATIFRQLVDERTGTNAVKGLVYLVALDELNRFAPRGSKDPITQLIETVAAEMRSQGVILLGAQQQASKVSDKVIENAAIRVLGRSGSLELNQVVWKFLSESARRKAETLAVNEKLIIQDNFREPMHVRVPFPVWAMNPKEAKEPSVNKTFTDEDEEISTF